jgi:outer membrane protein assembly factor BamB
MVREDRRGLRGLVAWGAVVALVVGVVGFVPAAFAKARPAVPARGASRDAVPGGSAPDAAASASLGYWLVASNGGIFSSGNAAFHGSTGGIHLNRPIVGMARTASGHGYWLVASDGGIFSFGDAAFHGSTGAIHLNQPIVGIAPTPSGRGYWLVASDGGIFSFGDAAFHGSTGAIHLNRPIVAIAPTPTGHGYWLVASDGGIFSFGDAAFHGSTGAIHLNRPIVGIAPTPTGHGYWLVASDGGIFNFGDAAFFGSAVALAAGSVIVGMVAAPPVPVATRLVFHTQPGDSTAGLPFPSQPVVTLQDASGNTATGDTSAVTLALTPPGGAAFGCATDPVSAVAGVATFSGCSINLRGTYTLTATDGALTPAVSSTVQITGAATSIDFPAFMYDAAHSASSPATAVTPSSTLSLKYVFQEDKIAHLPRPEFVASPLVLQHVIYIGSNTGIFYAIDLNTGSVIWKEFLGFEAKATCREQGFFATAASGIDPATGALTIYAASGDGYVYALRASDGTILWSSPVNVPTPGTNDHFNFSAPEIANGKIYIGISSECDQPNSPITIRGGLDALDQANGNLIATYYSVPQGEFGGDVWSSPAIAPDGSVILTTGNGRDGATGGDTQSIVRLDGNTLARLDGWQDVTSSTDSDFAGSPTVFNANLAGVPTTMVGACNKDGNYYAWRLNALSAGPVWQVPIAAHNNSTGDCDGGGIWDGSNLYVGGCATTINGVFYRGSMRKLDPATGDSLWVTGLPVAIRTAPTLDAAGAIAATSFDLGDFPANTAFLINAKTGSYQTVYDGNTLAAPSPIFADQYLVIATDGGTLYTYQTN